EEPFEGAVDESRVAGGQLLVSESDRFHLSDAEVLEQDIGGVDEVEDAAPIGRLGDVELDAVLVAVERGEQAGSRTGQVAGLVAGPARFDLDHLGAEVGQDHPAAGPHDHVGELDDADAVERQRLVRRWRCVRWRGLSGLRCHAVPPVGAKRSSRTAGVAGMSDRLEVSPWPTAEMSGSRTAVSASTSTPVATPSRWRRWTRSSVPMLPAAPGAEGHPPSPPVAASKAPRPRSGAACALRLPQLSVSWRGRLSGLRGTASSTAEVLRRPREGLALPMVSATPMPWAPAATKGRRTSTRWSGSVMP